MLKIFTLMINGQPPLHVKADESSKVPPVTLHDAKSGPNGAKVLATYVIETGKPLALPAR
jgi:hypothetical protein